MLSECDTAVSPDRRELVRHGTTAFPIACYHDDLIRESVPWHWHKELEVAVVTEGSSRITIGNESYVVSEGEGFFVSSSVLHSCEAMPCPACRYHSLVFDPRLVGGEPGLCDISEHRSVNYWLLGIS